MQLNKIEQRRALKVSKLEEADKKAAEGDDDEKSDRVKKKKLKNLKKMMDYHSRKRREFHQREPIPLNQTSEVLSKRKRTK